MKQRYYDPLVAKFLSDDPMEVESASGANFNRYEYALSNPYKFSDPDGRCPWCVGAAIGGLISVAVEGYKQSRAGEFKPTNLAIEFGKGALGGALLGGVGGKLLGAAVEGTISAEAAAGGMAATGFAVGAGVDAAGRAAKGEKQNVSSSLAAGVVGAFVAPAAMAAEPAVGVAVGSPAVARTSGNLVVSNRGLAVGGAHATSFSAAKPAVERPITTGAVIGISGAGAESAASNVIDPTNK